MRNLIVAALLCVAPTPLVAHMPPQCVSLENASRDVRQNLLEVMQQKTDFITSKGREGLMNLSADEAWQFVQLTFDENDARSALVTQEIKVWECIYGH